MPKSPVWDIFCKVVDNYGDAAICWRLARQLRLEHGIDVRLWVDDPATLHALCPQVETGRVTQKVSGINVHWWQSEWHGVAPGDVIIEAFGSGVPDAFVESVASSPRRALWVVLEYLSAESWVPSHHGLPSPHRSGIPRYFYFPGFVDGTGGVLHERELAARRAAFNDEAQRRMWRALGSDAPAADAIVATVFAYENAPLSEMLFAWEQSGRQIVAAIPLGRTNDALAQHYSLEDVHAGQRLQRGSLEVRVLPFVAQRTYDDLLWSADINFVRGEDSFVRAQWAEKPFVWNIYPQPDGVHWTKLRSFLELYSVSLDKMATETLQDLWRAWNGAADISVHDAWRDFLACRPALESRAGTWARQLETMPDLASKLVQFCRGRLKY
jgi:uncharacterized repeat protein (TIGR03837 family)